MPPFPSVFFYLQLTFFLVLLPFYVSSLSLSLQQSPLTFLFITSFLHKTYSGISCDNVPVRCNRGHFLTENKRERREEAMKESERWGRLGNKASVVGFTGSTGRGGQLQLPQSQEESMCLNMLVWPLNLVIYQQCVTPSGLLVFLFSAVFHHSFMITTIYILSVQSLLCIVSLFVSWLTEK